MSVVTVLDLAKQARDIAKDVEWCCEHPDYMRAGAPPSGLPSLALAVSLLSTAVVALAESAEVPA